MKQMTADYLEENWDGIEPFLMAPYKDMSKAKAIATYRAWEIKYDNGELDTPKNYTLESCDALLASIEAIPRPRTIVMQATYKDLKSKVNGIKLMHEILEKYNPEALADA
jgi:hypothetical protein